MSQRLVSGAAAIRSLDAIRRNNARVRNVGAKAWQDRQGNVLALPAGRRTGQTSTQYITSEGAIKTPMLNSPPGMPQRSTPNMCTGRERYLSETLSISAGGGEGHFSLETPGAFCPKFMYVTSDDGVLTDKFIISVKSGLEEQVISGRVVASYFSTENVCCPVACFPCLCMPGVPLEVTIVNDGAEGPDNVTVGLVGDYYKVCPPNAEQMMADMRQACGNAKLIGFETSISDGDTIDFSLETPGKFCPSNMFIAMGTSAGGVFLESIEVGLDEQVIKSGFPIIAWSNENETCCLPFCVPCLCMPGVPLNLQFSQSADGPGNQTMAGVIEGSYSPAC